jgi:flavin-dependent dehydrogenase
VADSSPRGAGPLERVATARVAEHFVLVGDAAGYVDAITGEGLSIAFACAMALGELLPDAIAKGATREALLPYEAAFARVFDNYARLAHAVLTVARRPRLRRALVRSLSLHPPIFDTVLRHTVG